MANRYWVGGTATWDATAGTKWATTSGGAGGAAVPTAADDVLFDAASGAVTATASSSSVCRSLTCTGFTGTLSHPSATTVTIGDGSGGALTFSSGMTYTKGGSASSAFAFVSTSNNGGTGWPITTAGKGLGGITFDGVGGKWVLQDALSSGGATATITLTNGTFDTNNQTVTYGSISTNNSNTRTLTLGSSSISLIATGTAWTTATATNLTITANTATINLTGAGSTFQPASSQNMNGASVVLSGSGTQTIGGTCTMANLTRTGTAAKTDALTMSATTVTVTGTFTINGNSATNRVLVQSSTIGTSRTINAATVVASNIDFMDIAAAGAASWDLSAITGGSGDCGGNSGITFTAAVNRYGVVAGNWSSTATWSTASGGAGGASVPLSQDNVFLDANSGAGTYTADMPRLGKDLNCTGFTRTLATSSGWTNFGSLTLASGMSFSGTNALVLAGRGTHTFTSAGKSVPFSTTFQGPGSVWTLADAYLNTATTGLTVNDGTFNTNNQSITSSTFGAASGRTTTLNLGSSVMSLTNTGAGTIFSTNAAATVVSSGTSEIVISSASANSRTILWHISQSLNKLTYTVAASTGVLQLAASTGDRVLNTLNVGPSHSVRLFAGSVIHVLDNLTSGTSGNLVTFDTTTAGSSAKIAKQYIGPQSNVYSFFGTAKARDGYLDLDGAVGSYVSTPDAAALQITGDIAIAADVACNDWSNGLTQRFVARYDSGTKRSYSLGVAANGHLNLIWSVDGTTGTQLSISTTVLPPLVDGQRKSVAATLDVDDGAGNYVVRFYVSDDFVNWTLHQTRTFAGTTSIFAGNRQLEIGARDTGASDMVTGKIYRAWVRSGDMNGTIVASPDFTGRSYNTHDYLSIKDSTASGYGVWYAGSHSTNVSGNTGWIFDDPQREGWGVLL